MEPKAEYDFREGHARMQNSVRPEPRSNFAYVSNNQLWRLQVDQLYPKQVRWQDVTQR